MVRFVLVLFFCFEACKGISQKAETQFEIKLDTLCINQLQFEVINPNSYPIEITDPNCLVNTHIVIKELNGVNIMRNNKIRVNPKCEKAIVIIPANSALLITFFYTLDHLFMVSDGKNYSLKIEYTGRIKCGNKFAKIKKIIFDSTIKFKNCQH